MLFRFMVRKPVSKITTYLQYGFIITETETHYCPRCNHVLNAGPNYQPKYCDQCGQKLTFSGIRWKEDVQLGYVKRGETYEPVQN